MDEYIGVIKLFAGNFVPEGYMYCLGQTLTIASNQALYSIIGTYYGGDGISTFKLPDLQGRFPIGANHMTSPTIYTLGAYAGSATATLGIPNLPSHSHAAVFTGTGGSSGTPIAATVTVNAGTGGTLSNVPTGKYWGQAPVSGANAATVYTDTKGVSMAADAVQVQVSGGGGGITGGTVAIGNTGSGQAFTILPPYLVINFIICVNGTYPPRN